MDASKYDAIGVGYNTTRNADPYLLERVFCLLAPEKDGHYLDIGCGTGNYTIALQKRGFHFTGVDPSHQMLDEAKSKSSEIDWFFGSVEKIPFVDEFFNGAIATLTVHHWDNLQDGFNELFRVLKPGSNIVIFTSSPEQMAGYWLNHYFPEVMARSIRNMPSVQEVTEALEKSGFGKFLIEKYFVQDDLIDMFLQSGKNRPEIYFDKNIQRGISTFVSLANKAEIEEGLQKLRFDIDNNIFQSIRAKYENDFGDYMFIVAEKEEKG
jgi:ubiquinone/menaquinone biosynthesis C-methylase UbiE